MGSIVGRAAAWPRDESHRSPPGLKVDETVFMGVDDLEMCGDRAAEPCRDGIQLLAKGVQLSLDRGRSHVGCVEPLVHGIEAMVVYSSKHDARQLSADLTAQLSESLALLGTAQAELKNKADLLNRSVEIASATEAKAKSIEELEREATKVLGKI